MTEEEIENRARAKDFTAFVFALRSETSHRPKCGFKGVAQRQNRFEARNSPFPVRFPVRKLLQCCSLSASCTRVPLPKQSTSACCTR